MNLLIGILFFGVFFGLVAFAVISGGWKRKLWKARPGVLRALASRRGYQFVENPGQPSELTPIRPVEKQSSVDKIEVPAAVKGRNFTLFNTRSPGSTVHNNTNSSGTRRSSTSETRRSDGPTSSSPSWHTSTPQRSGWWLGALDSLTIQKVVNVKSPEMGNFVPADELEGSIDETLEIERMVRARLAGVV